MKKRLAALAAVMALSACATVGPDYESPAPAAPAQTDFLGTQSAAFTGSEPPGRDTWLGYHRDLRRMARLRALLDLVIARLAN